MARLVNKNFIFIALGFFICMLFINLHGNINFIEFSKSNIPEEHENLEVDSSEKLLEKLKKKYNITINPESLKNYLNNDQSEDSLFTEIKKMYKQEKYTTDFKNKNRYFNTLEFKQSTIVPTYNKRNINEDSNNYKIPETIEKSTGNIISDRRIKESGTHNNITVMDGRLPVTLFQHQSTTKPNTDILAGRKYLSPILKQYENASFVIINNKVYQKKNYTEEQLYQMIQKLRSNKKISPLQNSVGNLRLTKAELLRNIDFEKYSKKDWKFLKSQKNKLISRAKTVKSVCEENRSLAEGNFRVPFVWDTNHQPNIVWCPQYKVASTSWMMNFLKMKHFNEDNPELQGMKKRRKKIAQYKKKNGASHSKVFELYPPPDDLQTRKTVFENAIRFMIVRHPFSRILSSYRDKMIKPDPKPHEFHFKEMQKEIIKKYRPKSTNEDSRYPTFSEFVDYVIDTTKSLSSPQQWYARVHCWVPYWVHCGVCRNDYNIIMKIETMNEDQQFLITLAKLEELKEEDTTEWRHLHNSTSHDIAPDYFSQLTRSQITRLYLSYKPDFDLFDYSYEEYLKYASH